MKPARLAVLGIAGLAGIGAYWLMPQEPPPAPALAPVVQIETVDVLVASTAIEMGHVLTPQDMRWQSWPKASAGSEFYILRSNRPDAIEQLTGWFARISTAVGEPIRESKLIAANGSGFMAAILPSGMRAVATEVSYESTAGGFILPNDRVDVIMAGRDEEVDRMVGRKMVVSKALLTDVRVLAINQTVQEKNGERTIEGRTATLELTPQQVIKLSGARQAGWKLSLSLRSLADAKDSKKAVPKPDEEEDDAAKSLNMVRFGVSTTTLLGARKGPQDGEE